MKLVQIKHDRSGGRATVPESAVPTHERAGWTVVKQGDKSTHHGRKPRPTTAEEN